MIDAHLRHGVLYLVVLLAAAPASLATCEAAEQLAVGTGEVREYGPLEPMEPKYDHNESSAAATESPANLPPRESEQLKTDKMRSAEPSPRSYLRLETGIKTRELAVQWDDWHNQVGRTVVQQMFTSSPGEALNMPQGLLAWYRCRINSKREVVEAEITRSSGNLWYDGAVLSAVRRLQGNAVLQFPEDSRRSEVTVQLGIRMGGEKTGFLRFDDVEYSELSEESEQTETAPSEGRNPKKRRR